MSMQQSNLRRVILGGGIIILLCGLAPDLQAGGSGLNAVVVINQNSSNSCELGNYFCEQRQVPPENVLHITWTGGNISWGSGEFQTNLLNPLLDLLVSRQLTHQVDYVVLSMDIPFQTVNGSAVNSTTSALFYGLKSDSAPDWLGITNSYSASEQIFHQAKPASAPGYSFLATMITSDSLANAKRLVDQGAASDGTFPGQPVILEKSSDTLRNTRYRAFDNAIFNTRLCGDFTILKTNSDSVWGQANLLGFETGLANFSISPGTFVPGAMADSVTSFGGIIFGPNGQTTLLSFINAGASGSYGTVTEPAPSLDKFPNPQVYFYQARGFSLAECYYQSVNVPYQGLIVGEPLAAPFQRLASGTWPGLSSNAVLSGTAQLSVQFAATDRDHPLQQVDLFVDGKYLQTLTNLPPLPGNRVNLTLNGQPLSYTVPTNSTIASVASGLGASINVFAAANGTKIAASVFGDRVELHFLATTRLNPPGQFGLLANLVSTNRAGGIVPGFVSSSAGAAVSLSTFVTASRDTFMESPASGIKACSVNGTMQIGTWLQLTVTKTNGTRVSLAVTNQSASATPLDLTGPLLNRINLAPALQGSDGLVAEDFMAGFLGSALFNLRARGPGHAAPRTSLTGSGSLVITPAVETALDDNLSDLQPRNHLYVRAGATNLALTFPLDTTTLAEGFHELTAVAYEGSHVRTQTEITAPVRIQNTALSATLTPLDLPDTAPVQGAYHLQVTASTNNVSVIRLFSTGGELNSITNQSSAIFTVNGSSLGAGLHPFYAVVETAAGLKYRTQPRWVRLVSGQ
jgi:uncharacterized protein (TIGR03790 family)